MAATSTKKMKCHSPRRKRLSAGIKEKACGFPYFAHEQLDERVFPIAVGLPVGGPRRAPVPEQTTTMSSIFPKDDYSDTEGTKETDTASPKLRKKQHRARVKDTSKRSKTTGGRPALAKRVTADLDSDDELIVQMKNAKYRETEIAQRLADAGRIKYNPKTIGTRWNRIKKKQREQMDRLLDQQRADWHDGDDEALREAVHKATKDLAKLQQELEKKMWMMVADNLKSARPVTNFSSNACQARLEALNNGTAKPTPESIPNPDQYVLERIRARDNKARKIEQDAVRLRSAIDGDADRVSMTIANLRGNAWTSKQKRHD